MNNARLNGRYERVDANTVKVTKYSIHSKEYNTLELKITDEQIKQWEGGMLIQRAMPHLTSDEREFLISGLTAQDWKELFGEDEKEN